MKSTLFLAIGFAFALIAASPAISNAEMVTNGDFEANGSEFVVWPGYVGKVEGGDKNPDAIEAWVGAGGVGINGPSGAGTPFGGSNTWNETFYAFMQGATSISQEISGFVIGGDYVLSLDLNSRTSGAEAYPIASAYLNDVLLASTVDPLVPVQDLPGNDNSSPWYHFDLPFTADAEVITLRLAGALPPDGGDVTWTVDNVSIQQVPEPASALVMLIGAFGVVILWRRNRN